MTVDEIIDWWCENAWTTTEQVTATKALRYANIVYHELEELVRNEIDEDYFYDYFTTDTVADQWEYVLEEQTWLSKGITKIRSVEILFSDNDTEYRKVRPFGSASLSDSESKTAISQSQGDPFYIIKDNSIFIYPIPDESVADWLRVHCSVNLLDLIAWSDEDTVKIPRNFHYVIALWMKKYIAGYRGLDGTAKAWVDLYEQWKKSIISYLKNRTSTPIDQDLPVLTNLQY